MASSSTSGPSSTQLLFARSVIYTFELWPALRLAVSEQWGGIESKAKADFLISYLCDQYSAESSAPTSSTGSATATTIASSTPDVDDLAEILEGYFADEFESRLEDDSCDLIASRLVHFHKIVYATFPPTEESLAKATQEVNSLEQAAIARRGQKVVAQQQQQGGEDEDISDDGQSGSEEDSDAMEVDTAALSQNSRPEPIVDEDGFTTVVKSRRR